MTSLLSLPPELKSIIVETLNLEDVKNLRLSCRLLGSFLENFILRTISFDINAGNLCAPSGVPKLQHLATKKSRAASTTTKCLIISCLSPEYDPTFETESYVDGRWVANTPPKDTPIGMIGRKQVELYLFHALASLKNVSSVSWQINQYDEEWAQRTVVKALLSLPKLRSLRVDIDWARIPIPLHQIQKLYDITIVHSKPSSELGFADQTYLNLGKMISRSPQLCGIHIHRGDHDPVTADSTASLNQLFWGFPSSATPLRLTSLSLNKVFMRLDQHTLPHLHHLTSLDLSNMLEPDDKLTYDQPYDNIQVHITRRPSDHQASQKSVGSAIDSIWLTLIDIGVQLEEISANKVTSGLLSYLETYSGAKRVHLKLTQNHTSTFADSEELASRFFGSSLGRHVTTLRDLHIEAADEGSWCFGENNKVIISACRRLHSLGISISSSSLKATSHSSESLIPTPTPSFVSDAVANSVTYSQPKPMTDIIALLDIVSRQLPNLHTLNLTVPACIDRFEGYWCGYSVSQQFSWVCDVVAERLCAYSQSSNGPVGNNQHPFGLPTVVIGEKTCKEKRLEPMRLGENNVTESAENGASLLGCRWIYREV